MWAGLVNTPDCIENELGVEWEETLRFCRNNYDELLAGIETSNKNLQVIGKAKLLHFGYRIILLIQQARGVAENFLKTMLIYVVQF